MVRGSTGLDQLRPGGAPRVTLPLPHLPAAAPAGVDRWSQHWAWTP